VREVAENKKHNIFRRWEGMQSGFGDVTADHKHCFYFNGKKRYEVPPSIPHLWIGGKPPADWKPLDKDDPDWAPLLTTDKI
jgi:hypothetical protein